MNRAHSCLPRLPVQALWLELRLAVQARCRSGVHWAWPAGCDIWASACLCLGLWGALLSSHSKAAAVVAWQLRGLRAQTLLRLPAQAICFDESFLLLCVLQAWLSFLCLLVCCWDGGPSWAENAAGWPTGVFLIRFWDFGVRGWRNLKIGY